jgi:hypothetical protein
MCGEGGVWCDVGGRWGEDVAGIVYGVGVCGVVWACEVWEMQGCGVVEDDFCVGVVVCG